MSGFSFADTYKAAGFTPGPEIIRLRQEAFDVIRKEMKAAKVVDAVRLYFGLPVPDGAPWFRDAFAAIDPSFTMLDNEREAAILSACLLSAEIDSGNVGASFAPLTAAAVGNREPLVQPGLIEQARQALHTAAVAARRYDNPQSNRTAPKVDETADALAQNGDWAKAAVLLKQIATEGTARSDRLAAEVHDLREEVDMLWWYIGGWSRILEQPFSTLGPGPAALMAGIDLADLTKGEVGPAAASAILLRVISAGRKKQAAKVTLGESVDGLPAEGRKGVYLPKALGKALDICPVLGALAKAVEIGKSPAWHESFKSASHLEVSAAFNPADLALQVFRERQLLAQLE